MEATESGYVSTSLSKSGTPISQADEIKAVALLARGDSQNAVAREVGISSSTVRNIQERNAETLASIKAELILRETKKAKRILDRSHAMIDKKLDNESAIYEAREKLQEKWDDGEVTPGQYAQALRGLPTLTLAELTALSKEMFNQSQIEEGKPTTIAQGAGGSPKEAEQKLQDLIDALHGNDEVKMLELMANDNS